MFYYLFARCNLKLAHTITKRLMLGHLYYITKQRYPFTKKADNTTNHVIPGYSTVDWVINSLRLFSKLSFYKEEVSNTFFGYI